MSGYAYMWAKRQVVGDPAAKNVLKSYAHWASEDYSTWVTNEELLLDTELNIQTIRKARQKLIALGYLIETKRRMGETRSIVVYQMIAPDGSTVVQSVDGKGAVVMLSPPSREEYEAKQVQKRSPSKSTPPSKRGEKQSPSKSEAPPNPTLSPSKSHVKGGEISSEAPPNFTPKLGLGLHELGGERDAGARGAPGKPDTLSPNDETGNPEPVTSGFDRFWDAWPSASGRKQAAVLCRAHWDATGLEAIADDIVAHVDAMTRTQHWRTGGDPTPIRYLEQKRWADGLPEPAEEAARTDDAPWWETDSGIEARARELDVVRQKNESTPQFLVRVAKQAGKGPHIEPVLRAAQRVSADWHHRVVEYLGDALIPVDYFA